MVLTPAPNSRRPDVDSSALQFRDNWTLRFRKASASRLNRKVSFLTLASCAFLLPGSLSTRSQASPESSQPAASGPLGTVQSASSSPESVVASPTPDDSLSSSPSLLQSLKTSGPQITSALQLPQSSSQPSPSPRFDAPLSRPSLGASKPFAAPATSLSPVAKLAPLPASAPKLAVNLPASSAKLASAVPTKIRVRAVVRGEERQAQIAVTPKMTVGQALAAMGISLAALDRVMPEASALAREGLLMRVTRIENGVQKRRIAIPVELRYQPTTQLKAGAKQTLQAGKSGFYEVSERVWKRDGLETKREFVSRRLALAPQHKIVALGVKSHLMPGVIRPHRRYAAALPFRGGTPRDRMLPPADPRTFAPVKSFSVLATGYSAGPAGGAIGNWTATGVRCTYGAVAVDPRLIPLGSKLYIEGYGYGFACDTGGAIKGRHIDLAFDSPRAAFRHGKKRTTVWVLGS